MVQEPQLVTIRIEADLGCVVGGNAKIAQGLKWIHVPQLVCVFSTSWKSDVVPCFHFHVDALVFVVVRDVNIVIVIVIAIGFVIAVGIGIVTVIGIGIGIGGRVILRN